MRRLTPAMALSVALAGCTLAPTYSRQELTTRAPDEYRQHGTAAQGGNAKDQGARGDASSAGSVESADAWWRALGDAKLDALVDEALKNNQDLIRATARVEQFAGSLKTTRSAFFPQFDYAAGAGARKIPPAGSTTLVNAGLTAAWEIDLFGRVRSATRAARAELMSSEETRRGVQLSLVTAVVAGYVNLRSLDRQLEIAEQTARTREEALKLFRSRQAGGVISGVEFAQQESEYEAARAAIPTARQAVNVAENDLAVLLGRTNAQIPRGRGIDELRLAAPPAGLPSDLLERRPDLRSAEQQLIAANARIGEARAQYFPSISLTGLLGVRSDDMGTLFDGDATWRYAGAITGPIFRFGAIKGQVEAAKGRRRELLASYQRAIQVAFADTDRALSAIGTSREKLEAQTRQEAALSRYANLARKRYDGGYTSYIDVLDAERTLFSVQVSRAQTQADTVIAVVNLYKALGGSWVDTATAPATAKEEAAAPTAPEEKTPAQAPAPAESPAARTEPASAS